MSNSTNNATIYRRHKALECIQCGTQDWRTLEGRWRCAECADKQKKRQKWRYYAYWKEARQRAGDRYQERKEKKCCVRCGRRDERTTDGKSLCAVCAKKQSEYEKKSRGKKSDESA